MNSYYVGFTRPKTQKLPGSGYRGIIYMDGKRVWLCDHEHTWCRAAYACAIKERDARNRAQRASERQAADPATGGQ